MDKDRIDQIKFDLSEDGDSTIEMSMTEINPDNSVNYQTAEENSSKYFSVIEDSTLENIDSSNLSLQTNKDTSDYLEIESTPPPTLPFESSDQSVNILNSLSNIGIETVNKFNIHEKIDTANILSGGVDIFDDNESSVDGHELVIDDDPQPSEKSDDCLESGTEMSIDMQYKYDGEDTNGSVSSLNKSVNFGVVTKTDSEENEISHKTQIKISSSIEDEIDSSPKQIVGVKIFSDDPDDNEIKADSYNFSDSSHRVTLLIDGNNVEAINIGQDIYIYPDSNGELTAFQVIKDDGNPSIKYLHVGKNEDGNIEVYEEQVNQVVVSPDSPLKEKDTSKLSPVNILNANATESEHKLHTDRERNSQDIIKAVMEQEKLLSNLNPEGQSVTAENKTITLFGGGSSEKFEEVQKSEVINLMEEDNICQKDDSLDIDEKLSDILSKEENLETVVSEKMDDCFVIAAPVIVEVSEDSPENIDLPLPHISETTKEPVDDNIDMSFTNKIEEDTSNSCASNDMEIDTNLTKYDIVSQDIKPEENDCSLELKDSLSTTSVDINKNEKKIEKLINSVSDDISMAQEKSDNCQVIDIKDSFEIQNADNNHKEIQVSNFSDNIDNQELTVCVKLVEDTIDNENSKLDDTPILGTCIKIDSDDTLNSGVVEISIKEQSNTLDEHNTISALSEINEDSTNLDEIKVQETSLQLAIDDKPNAPSQEEQRVTKFETELLVAGDDSNEIRDITTQILPSPEINKNDNDNKTEVNATETETELLVDDDTSEEIDAEVQLSVVETPTEEDKLTSSELVCGSSIQLEDDKITKREELEKEIDLPNITSTQLLVSEKLVPISTNDTKVPLSNTEMFEKDVIPSDNTFEGESISKGEECIPNVITEESSVPNNLDDSILLSCDELLKDDNTNQNDSSVEMSTITIENLDGLKEKIVVEDEVLKNSLQISDPTSELILESDDEFEEYVEGEPVTGDSGIDWSDENIKSFSKDVKEPNQSPDIHLFVKGNYTANPKNKSKTEFFESSSNIISNKSVSTKAVTHLFEEAINNENKKSDKPSIPNNASILLSSVSNEVNVNNSIINMSSPKKRLKSPFKPCIFPSKETLTSNNQLEDSSNSHSISENDLINESFESFHPKNVLKTYSREVKSNLSPNLNKKVDLPPSPIQGIVAQSFVINDSVSIQSSIPSKLNLNALQSNEISVDTNESKNGITSEELLVSEISPKSKSRQPRKQVFTPVARTDIEIIFPRNEKFDKSPVSPKKTTKTYSRSKHRNEFERNLDSKCQLNVHKSGERKSDNKISKIKDLHMGNFVELNEGSVIANKVNIESRDVSLESADKTVSTLDNSLSPIGDKNVKILNISNSPSSNSAKRKRGRPKKILLSNPNTYQSQLLNADDSIKEPLLEPSSTPKIDSDVVFKENLNDGIINLDDVKQRDNVSPVDEEKTCDKEVKISDNEMKNSDKEVKNSDKEIKSFEESGKRKKGRPRKILSMSLNITDESIILPSNLKRKSLPDANTLRRSAEHIPEVNISLNLDKNSENVCPICSKTFRSSNVLLKHAKHCNGLINIETIKLKRKKSENVKIESEARTPELESKTPELESKTPELESKTPELESKTLELESKEIDLHNNVSENMTELSGDISLSHVEETVASTDIDTNEETENVEKKSVESKISHATIVDEENLSEPLNPPANIITENPPPNIISENIPINLSDNTICEEDTEVSNGNENPINKLDFEQESKKIEEIDVVPEENKQTRSKMLKGKQIKKPASVENKTSPMSRLTKFFNTKPPPSKIIQCEICNKSFRQLAHMVYHRSKHETEKLNKPINVVEVCKPNIEPEQKSEPNTILKCEICKKGFRKLHHLVEHREMHANNEIKSRRTSVASVKSEPEGGFRCDTCDKSFRKLHHLVEHRELHLLEASDLNSKQAVEVKEVEKDDATCTGCGKSFRKRHHMIEHRDIHCSPSKKRLSNDFSESNVRLSIASTTSEESNNCGICGKSYRKLYHMVEHRESHIDSNPKIESRVSTRFSMPNSLNTKDIIHECPKCYMVFPNEKSLNKHTENCARKKLLKKMIHGDKTNKIVSTDTELTAKNKVISNVTNESLNNNLRSSISSSHSFESISKLSSNASISSKKSKSTTKIPTGNIKKIRLETNKTADDESKIKYKINSDFQVKYRINPAYKTKRKLPVSNVKVSPDTISKSKLRLSNDGVKAPNTKLLETIMEETTVRYSFPKTPKAKERQNCESKLPKSSVRKMVSKNIEVIPKKKVDNKNLPSLTIKRKSLGGRKSLDNKKVVDKNVTQSRLRGGVSSLRSDGINRTKALRGTSKSHKCDCGKQFENEILLKRHMDTEHTPPKSYRCHKCGVSVRTAAQFTKHKKGHETESQASAAARPKKSPRHNSNISSSARKQKVAHGGVPLPEKIRKAMGSSKVLK